MGKYKQEAISIKQMARYLNERPSRVAYVVKKYRIKPFSYCGRARLFTYRQAHAIQEALGHTLSRVKPPKITTTLMGDDS